MKQFEVTVTEKYTKKIIVEAETAQQAEDKVTDMSMAESVEYPLTDGGDVLNFCELLSDSIGVPVYANEKHRQAKKLSHYQLSNILGAA